MGFGGSSGDALLLRESNAASKSSGIPVESEAALMAAGGAAMPFQSARLPGWAGFQPCVVDDR